MHSRQLINDSIANKKSSRDRVHIEIIEFQPIPRYEENEITHRKANEVTEPDSSKKEEIEPLLNNVSENNGVLLFGYDISHLNRTVQFSAFVLGVFVFTVIYGCLQELLAVKILNRQLGLFLTTVQFAGYAFWSFVLSRIDARLSPSQSVNARVPSHIYIGLALLRAVDVGMTNVSMQYLNYPAKVLIKSSRVAFTMVTGTMFGKRYGLLEYFIVSTMICGLVVFLNADAKSAVFHPIGVALLVIALLCDGMINNWSEISMAKYHVGHNEFLCHLYTIAFLSMTTLTYFNGELLTGLRFLSISGTYLEANAGHPSSCAPFLKVMVIVLFATTGLFGSSCAAGITKYFGAMAMSITSTARKAMTLFLSFIIFQNSCTMEHIIGMVIFLFSLCTKSFMVFQKEKKGYANTQHHITRIKSHDRIDSEEDLSSF